MRDTTFRGVHRSEKILNDIETTSTRSSYSFETNSRGHIPLICEWEVVLQRLSLLGYVFMQVDHPYGRMSMRLSAQNFQRSMVGDYLKNGFELNAYFETWSSAYARIEQCACCSSPGGFHVQNTSGRSFLHINPPGELSPSEWADLLRPIAISRVPSEIDTSECVSDKTFLYPEGAVDLGIRGMECLELFKRLAEDSIEVEFTICTTGIRLRQSYVIQQLNESNGILECFGQDAGFNVYLPSVMRTAVMFDQGHLTLYLIGPDEQLLFVVRAAMDEHSEFNLHSILGV